MYVLDKQCISLFLMDYVHVLSQVIISYKIISNAISLDHTSAVAID